VKFSMGVFQLVVDHNVLLLGVAAGLIMDSGSIASRVEVLTIANNGKPQGCL